MYFRHLVGPEGAPFLPTARDVSSRPIPALGGLAPTWVERQKLNGVVNPRLTGSWGEFGDHKGLVVYPW